MHFLRSRNHAPRSPRASRNSSSPTFVVLAVVGAQPAAAQNFTDITAAPLNRVGNWRRGVAWGDHD